MITVDTEIAPEYRYRVFKTRKSVVNNFTSVRNAEKSWQFKCVYKDQRKKTY